MSNGARRVRAGSSQSSRGGGGRPQVHEHEPRPGRGVDPGEIVASGRPRGELLGHEDEGVPAVERVAPAVERTAQLVDATGAARELHAAVAADVVERQDSAAGLPDHEHGVAPDPVFVEAALVRQILLATGHLPDGGEEPLVLQCEEVSVRVAALRDEGIPEPPPLRDAGVHARVPCAPTPSSRVRIPRPRHRRAPSSVAAVPRPCGSRPGSS